MKLYLFIITLSIIGNLSIQASNEIVGKYRTNFPSLGFFMTVIDLKDNNTFHYTFSGDLTHTELDGTYDRSRNTLYLKFNKQKYDYNKIELNEDGVLDTSYLDMLYNSHSYDLKEENNIEYHIKYKIKKNKLKVYHISTGKLVRRAKWYTNRKRYIVFGSNYKKKKFYLKKIK